ncbi:MGDG synthase family glycosyltransferase [Numidum massiliense]|uniref:MGDG synthase family glycosyltransferase n=1 Tax=Numidum massiliense TaxID=1522315 RepID=UPI0006D58FCC|nr:glycosyltransferase [Numidum massiliense]
MRYKYNILISTANYGEGHKQAARALQQAFGQYKDTFDVDVLDFANMVHPVFSSVTQYCYEQSVKKAPKLYGLLYKQTERFTPTSRFHRRVSMLGVEKMKAYLRDKQPDAIVNTFPFPAGSASLLKEHGLLDVPTTTVITDHALHPQWIHKRTDFYFVGSERVKRGLINYGIPAENVQITGIPIRQGFHETYDRQALKQKYDLDERPTVLVMGGWHGVFNAALCEWLVKASDRVQVIFVCGRDQKLQHKLWPLQVNYADRVRVFGFVNNIPELMAVSDFIMTKAGGLTTSEALAMGLPMLLFRPIPGQEEENARYLIGEGAAYIARNQQQLMRTYSMLCNSPETLASMKKNVERIKPFNCSDKIIRSTLKLIHAREKAAVPF